jgi:hypothetical protein
MWFTGRFSGAATVLVLDPSQVTVLPEPAAAFDAEAEVCVLGFVVAGAGLEFEEVEEVEEEEEEEEGEEGELELAPGEEALDKEEFAVVVEPGEAPSLWTPVPSLHAVRESAARTTVAAEATKRVREVRNLDMRQCPLGVRVGW